MSTLHQDSLIIDGLIISKWSREVFEDMKKGGLSAANCTVSVWDDFKSTVHNIAEMDKVRVRRIGAEPGFGRYWVRSVLNDRETQ